MEETQKQPENIDTILVLKRFFTVSNAAFTFMHTIQEAFGNKIIAPNAMEALHKIAFHELEREKPDMDFIDKLLHQMELQAEKNGQPKIEFPRIVGNEIKNK